MVRLVFFLALVLLLSLPTEAQSEPPRCLGQVCFAPQTIVGEEPVKLQGISLFEYWSFDVYTGAFYSAGRGVDAALAPLAKKLVLYYHRAISKEDFITSTQAMMKKNPSVNLKEIAAECARLFELFQSVKPGDRYSIEFVNGRGTTLSLNDKALGTIAGDAFQRAMFGIWLSKYSVGAKFTDRVLGAE